MDTDRIILLINYSDYNYVCTNTSAGDFRPIYSPNCMVNFTDNKKNESNLIIGAISQIWGTDMGALTGNCFHYLDLTSCKFFLWTDGK